MREVFFCQLSIFSFTGPFSFSNFFLNGMGIVEYCTSLLRVWWKTSSPNQYPILQRSIHPNEAEDQKIVEICRKARPFFGGNLVLWGKGWWPNDWSLDQAYRELAYLSPRLAFTAFALPRMRNWKKPNNFCIRKPTWEQWKKHQQRTSKKKSLENIGVKRALSS